MNLLNATLAALALSSLALMLWQWLAARRFPLHQRDPDAGFTPALTLLKPLKGCDDTTSESLQSWFKQNYPGPTQILFGVADANDPVCPLVRELIKNNPGSNAQLIICAEAPGWNGKVSTLSQLERLARHCFLLVSDGDVRVPPDFLANVVTPLRDDKIGLVSCFYRLANPTTTAMRWEAAAINADFWSQVLQAASLKPPDFALGAVTLVRRGALVDIGGFQALADCLADDYQLGHRLAKHGWQIAFCPVVVECWTAPMNWRAVWRHQLRWARTIRMCRPLPYFFSILSNATLWLLLWLIVSSVPPVKPGAALVAIVGLFVRIALAQNLQRRLTQTSDHIAFGWLVPVKDLLQAAVWVGAFGGNTVEWGGQQIKLRRDGTLIAEK